MTAGDVTVQIHPAVTSDINAAVTALRVSANDHWNFIPLANGIQIMIVHIEEA